MNPKPIRVLIVDAEPERGRGLSARLGDIEGLEIVGVAYSRNAAKAEVKTLEPDVLLVDLMLPGQRSIDIVRHVADVQPQVHVLALSPADPPHDRIILAAEAGALGYVCRDADLSEFEAAIEQVYRGEPWLPLQQTYEVLQDGAAELAVSSSERRDRLAQMVLGFIPLTGLIAAFIAYLWRQYWGAIDVRVADLGVDPTTRMTDVLVVFLRIVGMFGPLLFVRPWVAAFGDWIEKDPKRAAIAKKVQSVRLGSCMIWMGRRNRWGPCTWMATPTCTCSMTPVQRSSDSCPSVPRGLSLSTRSPAGLRSLYQVEPTTGTKEAV